MLIAITLALSLQTLLLETSHYCTICWWRNDVIAMTSRLRRCIYGLTMTCTHKQPHPHW